MFSYIFQSNNTLLSGLTVIGDTVTLFDRIYEKYTDISADLVLTQLRQCFPGVSDLPYRFLSTNHFSHMIRELHPDEKLIKSLHQQIGHYHFVHNGIVTPEKFTCLIEQIEALQNHSLRETTQRGWYIQLLNAVDRIFGEQATIDTTTDLIPPSEINELLDTYQKFYDNHADTMAIHYNNTLRSIEQHPFQMISEEVINTLPTSLLESVFSSVVVILAANLINRALQKCGVRACYSEWISNALCLVLISFSSSPIYPLIISASTLVFSKMVGASSSFSRLFSITTAIATVVAENFNYTASALLNFTLCAYYTHYVIDQSSHFFQSAASRLFPKTPSNESNLLQLDELKTR